MRKQVEKHFYAKKKCVRYFVPFTKYVQDKLGIDVSSLTLAMADKLIRILNVGAGKDFMLSFNAEEAKLQLEKIGYHSKKSKKLNL